MNQSEVSREQIIAALRLGKRPVEISLELGVTRNRIIGIRRRWCMDIERMSNRPMNKPASLPLRINCTPSPFRKCQYLHGNPKQRKFCGKPNVRQSSYCDEHLAICTRAA